MKLSIIVPVLNEVSTLPALLQGLLPLREQGVELIVVDGGSDDGSVELARNAGVSPLAASRGRARQMNDGAARASGDVLLFLHADTQLPPQAVPLVTQALASAQRHWGRFDVRIIGRARMLRVVASLMNARSRLSGIATGDQAMFVRRDTFEAVGGFPDQPLMEDIELSRRLRAISRPACLRARVSTSGRRWETRGVWRTILLMWRLRWDYWRGVSAAQLAQVYQ